MKKSRLDYLLDKEFPTIEDHQEMIKILESKSKLNEQEKRWLRINKILLKCALEKKEKTHAKSDK